jgi:hypothetical protein
MAHPPVPRSRAPASWDSRSGGSAPRLFYSTPVDEHGGQDHAGVEYGAPPAASRRRHRLQSPAPASPRGGGEAYPRRATIATTGHRPTREVFGGLTLEARTLPAVRNRELEHYPRLPVREDANVLVTSSPPGRRLTTAMGHCPVEHPACKPTRRSFSASPPGARAGRARGEGRNWSSSRASTRPRPRPTSWPWWPREPGCLRPRLPVVPTSGSLPTLRKARRVPEGTRRLPRMTASAAGVADRPPSSACNEQIG